MIIIGIRIILIISMIYTNLVKIKDVDSCLHKILLFLIPQNFK